MNRRAFFAVTAGALVAPALPVKAAKVRWLPTLLDYRPGLPLFVVTDEIFCEHGPLRGLLPVASNLRLKTTAWVRPEHQDAFELTPRERSDGWGPCIWCPRGVYPLWQYDPKTGRTVMLEPKTGRIAIL